MGRILVALISLLLLAPGIVHAAESPYWGSVYTNGDWFRYYGRGDAVTMQAGAGATGGNNYKMTAEGLRKYSYSPNAFGVQAVREVPLNIEASAASGLKRAAKFTVGDAIGLSAEALSIGGRIMVRNVLPVVGAGIMGYDVYKMIENNGLEWDDDQQTIVVDESNQETPMQGWQITFRTTPGGWVLPGPLPQVGQAVNSSPDLIGVMNAWAPTGTWCDANHHDHIWQAATMSTSGNNATVQKKCTHPPGNVDTTFQIVAAKTSLGCNDGFELVGSVCVQHHERPATDEEIESAIEDEDPAELVKLPPELAANDQDLPLPNDTPASYSVSPTSTTSPETTSTTTTRNPDGSTSTLTRHDTQTVTSQPQGDTLVNSSVAINITNNYYITNENNETVEDHKENPPPLPDPDPVPEDQPDDDKQMCDDGACDFDAPDIPEAKTFAESLSGLYDAIKGSPIASALGDLGALFPSGGACPTAEFDALESHFVIDSHCTLMDMYRGVIQGVMLFLYFLCGLLLFFKA